MTKFMTYLNELPNLNAIRFGNLFFKPESIHTILSNSVRLLAHEHIFDGESAFGIGGSCTLISHKKKAFVVTTRHQLKMQAGKQPSESHFKTIRFSTTEGGFLKNIPVDRCFHESENSDEEFHDFLFFRVEESWLASSADRPYFIEVEPFSKEKRIRTFFYGHPLSKNEISHDPEHIFIRSAHIDGQINEAFRSNARYFRQYKYNIPLYDVNGFSGGSAFSLTGDINSQLSIHLDGIITRAGRRYMYIIDSNYLIAALSQLF